MKMFDFCEDPMLVNELKEFLENIGKVGCFVKISDFYKENPNWYRYRKI